jgi:hypothetical protein
MIRTKPRAIVELEFVDAYQSLVIGAAKTISNQFILAPEYLRRQYIQKYKGDIARLLPIAQNKNGAGIGMDNEVARLRSLEYQEFYLTEHMQEKYFIGQTRPIIMQAYKGSKRLDRYNMGSYLVVIPTNAFVNVSLEWILFIPERDMFTPWRHPHHYIRPRDYEPEPQSFIDLLSVKPNTCWASVAPAVMGMLRSIDMVEAFRMLHVFLSRYDTNSPLISISYCDFAEKL